MAVERVEEHYHGDGGGSNSMAGILIAILFVGLILVLFFVFGSRFLQNTSAPSVNVPDQVDVNLEGGAQ